MLNFIMGFSLGFVVAAFWVVLRLKSKGWLHPAVIVRYFC